MHFLELGKVFQTVSLIFFSLFLENFHFHYPLLLYNLGLGLFIDQKIKIICSVLGFCGSPHLQEPSQRLQSSHHWRPRLMPLSHLSRCELRVHGGGLPNPNSDFPQRQPLRSVVAMATGTTKFEYTTALKQRI